MTPARNQLRMRPPRLGPLGPPAGLVPCNGDSLSGGIFVMVRPAAEDPFIRSRFVAAQKIRGISKIRLCQKYFHICTFLEAFCVFVRDIAFDVS